MSTNSNQVAVIAGGVPQTAAFAGAEAFDTAQRVARALASSSIVPAEYRGNVANVMVAMEYAHRIGASVLAVMQNLDVIRGRPALRATFLIATVNASGRFSPLRFRWQGTEGTDTWGCRAVAVDRESAEECLGPLISIALAKAEGWAQKTDSKWKTLPELMLMYRSAAFWTRVYAPELSMGLHTSDEMEDVGERHGGSPEKVADLNRFLTDDIPGEPQPQLIAIGGDDTDPTLGLGDREPGSDDA
jgi:hypothetical protein